MRRSRNLCAEDLAPRGVYVAVHRVKILEKIKTALFSCLQDKWKSSLSAISRLLVLMNPPSIAPPRSLPPATSNRQAASPCGLASPASLAPPRFLVRLHVIRFFIDWPAAACRIPTEPRSGVGTCAVTTQVTDLQNYVNGAWRRPRHEYLTSPIQPR